MRYPAFMRRAKSSALTIATTRAPRPCSTARYSDDLPAPTPQPSPGENDPMTTVKISPLAIALAAMFTCAAAVAQNYPTKQVRFVVGFPAGGATDVVARAISQHLSEALGQPVVVDNRAGAASNIAAEIVATAPKDGHTIFMGTVSTPLKPSPHKERAS